MAEAVSLSKRQQGKFVKKVKNVKEKVNKGVLQVKETVKNRKPREIRGLIYIGHIPHGFYEKEMAEYFKQFGKVTNVRLCRSKKTGQSKGYGFVEFLNPEVAQIVAETMNNYLMFNRRLISNYIPPEKQHRNLFTKSEWSVKKYPLKISRKAHIKRRNANPSDEKFIANSKKMLNKLKTKMNKLAELGVKHVFRPNDVPEDMTHLLEGSSPDGDIKVNKHLMRNEKSVKGVQQKLKTDFKITKMPDMCKELKNKSLKTIVKKKDKLRKTVLPKISFMQNERLKRLAAAEIVKDAIVNKINKLNKIVNKKKHLVKL